MKPRWFAVMAITSMMAATVMAAPAAAAPPNAVVTLIHGVPGILVVDVYADDELIFEGLGYDDIPQPGPMVMSAGERTVEVFAAGADPSEDPPIASEVVTLSGGDDVDVVFHLDESGEPTVSAWVSDLTRVEGRFDVRFVVRHTAAGGPIDVRFGEHAVLEMVELGTEQTVIIPETGLVEVRFLLAGTDIVVFHTVWDPDPGQSWRFYVVGDLASPTASIQAVFTDGIGPEGRYVDDDGSVHEANIETIARIGVTRGCGTAALPRPGAKFCPESPTTRGEMASFLVRALGLPSSDVDAFPDDDGSVHERDINALAEAGIARGHGDGTYGPDEPVRRDQMAAFLDRAFLDGNGDAPDAFVDDDGSIFEANIDNIAAAGITKGCNPPDNDRYCPAELVTRAEMASFLARALGIGD